MLHIIINSNDDFLGVSTLMTLNHLGFLQLWVLVIFLRFRVATHTLKVNCAEMAKNQGEAHSSVSGGR